MPDWIETAPFPASTSDGEKRVVEYPLVDDDLALLWMVNMGCIDMHAWASRVDRPRQTGLGDVRPRPVRRGGVRGRRRVALLVRDALDVPRAGVGAGRRAGRGASTCSSRSRGAIGSTRCASSPGSSRGALARAHPGLVTTEWTTAKRKGVLVDANQNGPGKTTASAYSVRPRAGAPVSTPLRWDEVKPGLETAAFAMDVVLDRVGARGRPLRARPRGRSVARRCAPCAPLSAATRRRPGGADARARRARRCRGGRRAKPSSRRRPAPSGGRSAARRGGTSARPTSRGTREPEARELGDALVAAERRDLAEHAVAVRHAARRRGSSRACAPGGARAGTSAGRDAPGVGCSARRHSRRATRHRACPSTRSVASTTTRPRSSSGGRASRAPGARTPAAQTSVRAGTASRPRGPPLGRRTTRGSSPTWISIPRPLELAVRVLPELARDLREDRGAASTSTQRCVDAAERAGTTANAPGRGRASSASASTPA